MKVTRKFDAAADSAWNLLIDTARWSEWGPSVRKVYCQDRYIRKGSQGTIVSPFGFKVRFLITEYKPRHFWGWTVAGIGATGHRVETVDHSSCRISFELPGYLFPYAIVCIIALQKIGRILNAKAQREFPRR